MGATTSSPSPRPSPMGAMAEDAQGIVVVSPGLSEEGRAERSRAEEVGERGGAVLDALARLPPLEAVDVHELVSSSMGRRTPASTPAPKGQGDDYGSPWSAASMLNSLAVSTPTTPGRFRAAGSSEEGPVVPGPGDDDKKESAMYAHVDAEATSFLFRLRRRREEMFAGVADLEKRMLAVESFISKTLTSKVRCQLEAYERALYTLARLRSGSLTAKSSATAGAPGRAQAAASSATGWAGIFGTTPRPRDTMAQQAAPSDSGGGSCGPDAGQDAARGPGDVVSYDGVIGELRGQLGMLNSSVGALLELYMRACELVDNNITAIESDDSGPT